MPVTPCRGVSRLLPLLLLTASAVGCAADADDSASNEDALSGLWFAEGSDEALTVLQYVNAGTTTESVLVTEGIGASVAHAIVSRRDGADHVPGTADDALFANLRTLDAVPGVGNGTLTDLYVAARDALGDFTGPAQPDDMLVRAYGSCSGGKVQATTIPVLQGGRRVVIGTLLVGVGTVYTPFQGTTAKATIYGRAHDANATFDDYSVHATLKDHRLTVETNRDGQVCTYAGRTRLAMNASGSLGLPARGVLPGYLSTPDGYGFAMDPDTKLVAAGTGGPKKVVYAADRTLVMGDKCLVPSAPGSVFFAKAVSCASTTFQYAPVDQDVPRVETTFISTLDGKTCLWSDGASSGFSLKAKPCSIGRNFRWGVSPDGSLGAVGADSMLITDGSKPSVRPANVTQTWEFVPGGRLRNRTMKTCLSISGQDVVLADCAAATTTRWSFPTGLVDWIDGNKITRYLGYLPSTGSLVFTKQTDLIQTRGDWYNHF